MLLWIIATLVGLVGGAFGLLWLCGSMLPKSTRTLRSLQVNAPAAAVIEILMDVGRAARGFDQLDEVSEVADGVWRLRFVMTELMIRPERCGENAVAWHTADRRGYFDAVWLFTARTEDGPTILQLEESRVYHSALGRAWDRIMLRPGHYVQKGLRAVARAVQHVDASTLER